VYPTLFHLGHLTLPTFGALAALGLIAALLLSERTATLAGLPPQKLWDAGIFAVLAAFLLSRLLLIVTFWKAFRAFPVLVLAVPSLTATGLLLTVIATALWLYFHRIPLLAALDAWAPCGALLWAALALGHFAEGSDPGLATNLPWAIPPMPGELTHLHPVALYAAILALLLLLASFQILRRARTPGTTAGATLSAVGVVQFLLSFLRQPGERALPGLDLLQIDLLQIAALGMILAGFALLTRTFLVTERQ
jgi:phosphatidylglycerol:prolipoprotein diacylglycerol transferase